MGDSYQPLLRPTFNGSLVVEGREERRTPLAGTALLRELDEHLGVTEARAANLEDPREAFKVQHSMTEILRTLTRALAAERRRDDPVMRFATSDRRGLSALGCEGQLGSEEAAMRERMDRPSAVVCGRLSA